MRGTVSPCPMKRRKPSEEGLLAECRGRFHLNSQCVPIATGAPPRGGACIHVQSWPRGRALPARRHGRGIEECAPRGPVRRALRSFRQSRRTSIGADRQERFCHAPAPAVNAGMPSMAPRMLPFVGPCRPCGLAEGILSRLTWCPYDRKRKGQGVRPPRPTGRVPRDSQNHKFLPRPALSDRGNLRV